MKEKKYRYSPYISDELHGEVLQAINNLNISINKLIIISLEEFLKQLKQNNNGKSNNTSRTKRN